MKPPTAAVQPAGAGGGWARRGFRGVAALLFGTSLLLAPPGRADEIDPGGWVVRRQEPPGATERYCAWFGSRSGETLYFGEAAFWTAFRAHGHDPRGDLRGSGPQRIGRMDLGKERLLPALDVSLPGARSGVWDVLAHPNGRVYFTTFFELSGWVDPRTGATARFDALGAGLAELALASGGQIVAARYGRPGQRDGSAVRFSADGFVMAEFPLTGPAGRRVAPKSVAYDPQREEIWVLTDLLPEEGDGAITHDARVIDRWGRERLRIERPEIQFVHFEPDGTGYLAEAEGTTLELRILAPGDAEAPHERGRRIPLDAGFPAGFDFVQDLQVADDGRVVAMRWSGFAHVIEVGGAVATLRMPRLDAEGLYYTGVLHGERLCATYCSDVAVACRDVAPAD
jgi:hypothetical protein